METSEEFSLMFTKDSFLCRLFEQNLDILLLFCDMVLFLDIHTATAQCLTYNCFRCNNLSALTRNLFKEKTNI